MPRLIVASLCAVFVSPAFAHGVRIDFSAKVEPTGAGSFRPAGSVVEGYIVYESTTPGTPFFTGATRFQGAVIAFEMGGLSASGGDVLIVGNGSTIQFIAGGLAAWFYGDSGATDADELLHRFPLDWNYGAFEINPPAEPFNGGQMTSYSSSLLQENAPNDASRELRVANEGTDSASCGWAGQKCRSISQAIRNAVAYDTVLVEPGAYGDLNGNGILGEPGEESGGANCDCLVLVDKSLFVMSEVGPAATIIDASRTGLTGVRVAVDYAAFGYAGQGFTVLAGRGAAGIDVDAGEMTTIWGNRVIGVHGLEANATAVDRARVGIVAVDSVVYNNEASGAVTGIEVTRGSVAGNTVTRNLTGMRVGASFVQRNVIVDNGAGLFVEAGGVHRIEDNQFVRNREYGVWFRRLADAPLPDVVFQNNHIVGNGFDPESHCGLRNVTRTYIRAVDNFWGAPGITDQACDSPGSVTETGQ